MAKESAWEPKRPNRTICLPIEKDQYEQAVKEPRRFRELLNDCFARTPELFPEDFAEGFRFKDARTSKKTGLMIRRIQLNDGTCYSIRPSFMMPYMTGRTEEVETALFLRRFGIPFWALAHVLGRNPMYWFRLEMSLGRNSVTGTTVRNTAIPEDLLADEHHRNRDGEKNYVATVVGGGCCLGAQLSPSAGCEALTEAYGVFRDEARNVEPTYSPKTVNTDGWHGTQNAWKALFPLIVILQCFLHAWLKIRERCRRQSEMLEEVSQKVWHVYHAPDRPTFSQRMEDLKRWATAVSGLVRDKLLDLCNKHDLWVVAYEHPGGHRTSSMIDRVMRSMNRYLLHGQHLHGSFQAGQLHCRAWALLYNFSPWHPAIAKKNNGWRSPAERLNQRRYHDNWLQNLLVSASLGGYRHPPQNA